MQPWIRNSWYVAGWASEVDGGKMLARTILGEALIFYRAKDGSIVAMEDRCCHRHAPLSLGRLEGDAVRCMYHGLLFDPSGQCIEIPGQEKIPDHMRVRSFPVTEKDTLIWVWTGEEGLADPKEIPEWSYLGSDDWRHNEGYIHYQSDYRLIVDNLLDFSHLAFVHANTIGVAGLAKEHAMIDRVPHGLRITKLAPDEPPSAHFKKLGNFKGNVDRWNIYDWYLRNNVLLMDGGSADVGTGGHLGDRKSAMEFRHISALTPESETSTHYFFAQCHGFALDSPETTKAIHAAVAGAFEEDKAMIEAQQKVINLAPDRKMHAIQHDGALFQVRRMISQAIMEETDRRMAGE